MRRTIRAMRGGESLLVVCAAAVVVVGAWQRAPDAGKKHQHTTPTHTHNLAMKGTALVLALLASSVAAYNNGLGRLPPMGCV